MSFVNICEKIDRVIIAMHCIALTGLPKVDFVLCHAAFAHAGGANGSAIRERPQLQSLIWQLHENQLLQMEIADVYSVRPIEMKAKCASYVVFLHVICDHSWSRVATLNPNHFPSCCRLADHDYPGPAVVVTAGPGYPWSVYICCTYACLSHL